MKYWIWPFHFSRGAVKKLLIYNLTAVESIFRLRFKM